MRQSREMPRGRAIHQDNLCEPCSEEMSELEQHGTRIVKHREVLLPVSLTFLPQSNPDTSPVTHNLLCFARSVLSHLSKFTIFVISAQLIFLFYIFQCNQLSDFAPFLFHIMSTNHLPIFLLPQLGTFLLCNNSALSFSSSQCCLRYYLLMLCTTLHQEL